jgi:ATP-binding cassette subfamily F protein 3
MARPVSHDRYFLNTVCTRIVEMVGGKLEVFKGNFDAYQQERGRRIATLLARIAKQKAQIAKLEDYVARNIAGQKARQARSKRKALAKIERIEVEPDPWVKAEQLSMKFTVGDAPGGKEVVRAEQVGIGFNGDRLVTDFDLTVFRGERIGIVGPNGCGKTTLLRALVGFHTVQEGVVRIGQDIRVGFFDQQRTDLEPDRTLVEEIRAAAGEVSLEHARTLLGRLRFSGDEVFRRVRTLSGGEQNRLALGKLAQRPHNVLALDEPTNHLDIPARQALERALADYPGTLLVVSHDRFFLDRLTQKTVFLTGDGRVECFWGGYTEAREQMVGRSAGRLADASSTGQSTDPGDAKALRVSQRKRLKERKRALEKMERTLAKLESTIAKLEARLQALDQELGSGNLPWPRLKELTHERQKVEQELKQSVEQWEELGLEVQMRRTDE